MTHNTREVEVAKEVIRKQVFLVPRSLEEANAMWATAEKAFDDCIHHQLQKAREEGERAVWERIKRDANRDETGMYMFYLADHSELDQDNK